jgi:hypothetical protein
VPGRHHVAMGRRAVPVPASAALFPLSGQ